MDIHNIQTTIQYYHPRCKEISTPGTSSCSFHENVISNPHIAGDVVGISGVSANHEEKVVDIGEDENKQHSRQEHGHPGAFVVCKHLQAQYFI